MSDYTNATAIVIGGSIGGLTTALLLRDLGFTVDVYERTPTALDGRGSGIVLQPDTVRWFTERSSQSLEDLKTSTNYVQYLDRSGAVVFREQCTWTYTSWGTFYRALLADFGTEHYHYGEYACGFDQDDTGATVRFVSGTTASADLVVFADGVTSVARERFDPEARLRYAGYIGWRGTVALKELSPATRDVLADAITYDVIPHSHITMYPIPGENSLALNDRLMNYVWYRNVPAGAELTEMQIDKRGFAGAVSVHPGQVQDRYVAEMKADAAELLAPAVAEVVEKTAQPYLQVLSDVRSNRMALGRVALIGDAACASRPHAAAGTAKAAADGWTLAAALHDAGGDIPAALTKWEPAQLHLSDSLLRRVVAMGDRSQFSNTWTPGDPDLRFGLYGPGLLTPKGTTMPHNDFLTDLPLAGDLVATDFEGWPDWLRTEFADHAMDGEVGSRLLSEDSRVRVWEIRLAPGQRWHAHRHVLDYFWTAVNAGRSRQHTHDGTTREVSYQAGETRHFHFGPGEYLLHDIENIGDGELVFTTVEHLDSDNAPLPIRRA